MIDIQKDIPIPTARRTRGSCRYPFRSMEVGDSFFVAYDGKKQQQSAMYSAIPDEVRRAGAKFCTRCVEENGVQGVRVWRTA